MVTTTGLYQKYRPKRLKDVVGQPQAVTVLEGLFKGDTFPTALLFTGGAGCGKTTCARILKDMLECQDGDFFELNAADFRGIDTVREIRRVVGLRSLSGGKKRIWLFDEAHQLSKDAQDAALKLLEDAPPHAHFFLCTTNPSKLKTTVRSRCTEIPFKAVPVGILTRLVLDVAEREGKKISRDVADRIAEAAQGSPRSALVRLEAVLGVEDEEAKLEAITKGVDESEGIDLARALCDLNPVWGKVAKILRTLDGEPESVRHQVLGYCQAILLSEKQTNPGLLTRAALVIRVMSYNLYDSLKPGLVSACYEAVHSGRK